MDFDAALSFLRTEIEKKTNSQSPVPKGFLEKHVKENSGISAILSFDMASKLIRHLETFYGTTQNDGHTLKIDFNKWYETRKGEIKFYFWSRLQRYWLSHSILPVNVVKSVDNVTDEIVGYLGDPQENKSWRRRGLVMGHVQSGKTTNYSALIAKAADAGYRVIIVLAGLTNSLRYQTQVRLDQTFVGKSSLGDSLASVIYPVSNVFKGIEGEGYVIRHPYCGTTQVSDFNIGKATGTNADEGNFADPILFVTKKHEKVLQQLAEWLRGLRGGGQIDGPMLLIDDEADNASINTAKDPGATSRINSRIRQLLDCSRRSSYVGYTATPFANIFIDPDTNDEMLKSDLFPEHFIKSLEPPENYIGAEKLFSENGELYDACVRAIPNDYGDILPLNHKAGDLIKELPQSLKDSVYEFVIFRCLRNITGDGERHSSMLVNVSRFNHVQQQVHDEIYRLLQDLKAAVDVWGLHSNWDKSEILSRLHEVWKKEYEFQSNVSWDEIRNCLKNSLSNIEIKLVNMRGGGLDYAKTPESGLHLIAVGGLALSRGLTLEGLAISYVLRNVGAADTLLQMGRWFGYRPGYENLCRIHTTESMLNDFREVSDSVEELRDDLVRMEKMSLAPDQFGLKVRQSSTGISITAANKMQDVDSLVMALNLSTHHLQAYEVFNSETINSHHFEMVSDFVKKLEDEFEQNKVEDSSALVWSNVNVSLIQKFIQNFNLPQIEFALGKESKNLALDYISDRSGSELKLWDVAIPFRTRKEDSEMLIPFPFENNLSGKFCRIRKSGTFKSSDNDIIKITKKNVVADTALNDLKYGERSAALDANITSLSDGNKLSNEKACLISRKRPLLIIHLVQFSLGKNEIRHENDLKLEAEKPLVTISLAFPDTKIVPIPREYIISPSMKKLMKKQLEEAQTDEDDVYE